MATFTEVPSLRRLRALVRHRRHLRHGHLFQNRYKSIVCDEDVYLKELVRYIHLNPLRVKVVKHLQELDRYRWCGYGVIMGIFNNMVQDRNFVLRYFDRKEGPAKKEYRKYVSKVIAAGRKSELVGGGLVHSLGGWPEVQSQRKHSERLLSDERILGSGDFVKRVIDEADNTLRQQFSDRELRKR